MSAPLVFCDAHVHVYPGADPARLLEAAVRNFRTEAVRLGAARWRGVLLLTEVRGVDWFGAALGGSGRAGEWCFAPTEGESISLRAFRGADDLLMVSGRQIATAERLEVHAFGTRVEFQDGQDLAHSIAAARAASAWTALPWGVGKWAGSRGRLVSELLRDPDYQDVLTADNGGRPWFWKEPRLVADARRAVLRGSDPLPLPGEEARAGESGFWLEGDLQVRAPAAHLLTRIWQASPQEIHGFGPMEGIGRFARNQLMLRLRKSR